MKKITLRRNYFAMNEIESEFDYLLHELEIKGNPEDIEEVEIHVSGYEITEMNN